MVPQPGFFPIVILLLCFKRISKAQMMSIFQGKRKQPDPQSISWPLHCLEHSNSSMNACCLRALQRKLGHEEVRSVLHQGRGWRAVPEDMQVGVGEGRSVKVCILSRWLSRVKNSFMLFPRSVLAYGFSWSGIRNSGRWTQSKAQISCCVVASLLSQQM